MEDIAGHAAVCTLQVSSAGAARIAQIEVPLFNRRRLPEQEEVDNMMDQAEALGDLQGRIRNRMEEVTVRVARGGGGALRGCK